MDDISYWDALAALEWQVELGADEAMLDAPLDRFDLPAPVVVPKPAPVARNIGPTLAAAPVTRPASSGPSQVDIVAAARHLAEGASSLEALAHAMQDFEHCELKRGARNFVFCDGDASARVMIVGEAPGREEDSTGKPFVGRAGQLLDRMFAAIGLDRNTEGAGGLYITNTLPWRPPQNRDPKPEELAMMVPFLHRHIELADPDVLVLMGNHACAGLLGKRGITRMRGTWEKVSGRPAMPMCHPAYLLRNPAAKREAWADLLAIKARLG
ncbi:uracil-DNA glycosylase [Jannaschia sp. EhC01]|nr:uracil-DNA glycosylase [Jannaschia sp. EhC01]